MYPFRFCLFPRGTGSRTGGDGLRFLYTAEEKDALLKKAKRFRTAMWAAAGAGFAICVLLCFFVRTANAGRMQIAVIAVSVLAGWAVILLRALGEEPARADGTHMEGLLSNPEHAFHTGRLTVKAQAVHLPRSIWVRRAVLTGTDGAERSLSVLARKGGELPPRDTVIRVETVRGYIIGWEVAHDEP